LPEIEPERTFLSVGFNVTKLRSSLGDKTSLSCENSTKELSE